MMLNNVMLYYFSSSTSKVDQNIFAQFINQELNSILETSCTKINSKPLLESYSTNFYSYEYYFRNLGRYPKIFVIISETDSEHNIRHSSFLL
ncbi:MAG: hypothetical protein OQK64_05600, partial [Ignavibacteriaceae bacterium]|nr:hypothetical protein [Ignavibacteriaceae bacterium]